MNLKRWLVVLLVLVILVGSTGISAAPAKASGCWAYHTVHWGESLSLIGRWYGVNWLWIAQANSVVPPRYKIFAGQVLCIPGGYYSYKPYQKVATSRSWSFAVTRVVKDTSVTIQTYNLPSNVLFRVYIGKPGAGGYNWLELLPPIDSGKGGSFSVSYGIPAGYVSTNQLKLRLDQIKRSTGEVVQTRTQSFANATYSPSSGGGGTWYAPYWGYGYWGIPTIWIKAVQRDGTVTVRTNNFPPNVNFDVYMGYMGTAGIGGIYVTTFNSNGGGSQDYEFDIPPQLFGLPQIAIRTQNLPTGYYSYNWFYNNTAYAWVP